MSFDSWLEAPYQRECEQSEKVWIWFEENKDDLFDGWLEHRSSNEAVDEWHSIAAISGKPERDFSDMSQEEYIIFRTMVYDHPKFSKQFEDWAVENYEETERGWGK